MSRYCLPSSSWDRTGMTESMTSAAPCLRVCSPTTRSAVVFPFANAATSFASSCLASFAVLRSREVIWRPAQPILHMRCPPLRALAGGLCEERRRRHAVSAPCRSATAFAIGARCLDARKSGGPLDPPTGVSVHRCRWTDTPASPVIAGLTCTDARGSVRVDRSIRATTFGADDDDWICGTSTSLTRCDF